MAHCVLTEQQADDHGNPQQAPQYREQTAAADSDPSMSRTFDNRILFTRLQPHDPQHKRRHPKRQSDQRQPTDDPK